MGKYWVKTGKKKKKKTWCFRKQNTKIIYPIFALFYLIFTKAA